MKATCKYLIILPFLLCSAVILAQVDSSKVNFIKGQFIEINNNLKFYKKVVKEDTAQTTEGNEVRCYFKGDTIKKIVAEYYGETGKSLEEYYFFNKKLIFYYFRDDHYKVPINVNSSGKIASTNEKRYYLNNGEIILILLKPKATVLASEYGKLSVEIQKEARRLLHLK
jgi:hypothetical protein